MSNVCLKDELKYIEQLPNGEWIVRYGVRKIGRNSEGKELVTYTSSQYPDKPSMSQIKKSIRRFALSVYDDIDMLETVSEPDYTLYDVE